jgi:hypothetical protein
MNKIKIFSKSNPAPRTILPEDGYVQTICPSEKTDKEQEDIYYYFKTPDGSRNLEAREVEEWDPIYPGYREWEEQWSR